MTVRASQLTALADAITAVLPLHDPADGALHQFFRRQPELGRRDRAFVADGVFALLRRRRSLTRQAESDDPRLLALAVTLRELGNSLRDIEPLLSSDEVAWARAFKGRHPELSPAEAVDLPDWLWDRLTAIYPEADRDALARSWLNPAPLDIRINPLKTKRDDVRAALAADGLLADRTKYSPVGLRIEGRPMLQRLPLFTEGDIEVQDEGSQILCYLLAPKRSDMVVDFCAGAGGKTLLLGAMMRSQGRLYAFDVSLSRLSKLKPRVARSGLSNVHPVRITDERDVHVKRLTGKIDRVLIDAPCSGFGTLRRNPDLKWRHQPADIAELAAKQARILASAATLVKRGGRLVYATCSVLTEENDDIVDAFLANNPGFEPVDAAAELRRSDIPVDTGMRLRLLPHLHGCDGFFAAVLKRTA
jgi:16S rRNA (cytosine967-C5)-methyltransferase